MSEQSVEVGELRVTSIQEMSKCNIAFKQYHRFIQNLTSCSKMSVLVGLSLLCSKIYLLFLPEVPKIFTYDPILENPPHTHITGF